MNNHVNVERMRYGRSRIHSAAFDDHTWDALGIMAQQHGVSRNKLIRGILVDFLDSNGNYHDLPDDFQSIIDNIKS